MQERVGFETRNLRQYGAIRDRFYASFAIPYQRRIDIEFVPIFPNACHLGRAKLAQTT